MDNVPLESDIPEVGWVDGQVCLIVLVELFHGKPVERLRRFTAVHEKFGGREDIRKNRLSEPIVEDAEGRLLDGRNRYRACLEAGVEPRFVRWEGEASQAELALSWNLHRRHLLVAARLAKLMEVEAVKRRGRRREENPANLQGTLRGVGGEGGGDGERFGAVDLLRDQGNTRGVRGGDPGGGGIYAVDKTRIHRQCR